MEDDGFHHQRYVLAFMLFLAIANAYAMRAVLSLAITVMVSHEKRKSDPNACPLGAQQYEFDWDETTQGLILGSFYWGYVIMHIPGGLLAQKFGGKHTLGFGILSTAIFTILTPMAAYMGPVWLIVWRFFEGLGEGTTFPAANQLLAAWIPKTERGKVGAFVWAGIIMGTVISSSLTGLLLKLTNNYWPVVFYLFGAVAILWFVVWLFIGYSEPGSNPFISQKEMDYLEETIGSLTRRKDLPPTPWKEMATSWPVIALVITQVGHDWGLFTIAADLPKYFASVIHFSVHSNGLLSALPFLFMWIFSQGAGCLSDFIVERQWFSMTLTRKIFATAASMGPAVGIILASYSGCNKVLAVMFFAIGMGFMGFYYPSIRINSLDLSPNYAATLMAIVNGLGAVSGIFSAPLIGIMTPNSTMSEWRLVFWLTFIILAVTNLFYLVFGSAEIQPWNDPNPVVQQPPPRSEIEIGPEPE
ncbi:hypothetical protein M8J75_001563 [Diaphorina citri]|nr:hypothetical protein M8J75_001563 [Diaphorina citri]